jgi:hypothetical protein
MQLEFVPLLPIQRELYRMPRGMERFHAYIRAMTNAETGDLALPLSNMNPMGKDHLPALLDTMLGFKADDVAQAAMASAGAVVAHIPGRFKVGLVVSDDAHGGWTDRYCTEFGHRFGEEALYKRGWVVGLMWTSETPTEAMVCQEVQAAIYRVAHIRQRGPAATLGAMLMQEGAAMAAAGCNEPSLDPDDLAYTREIIAPYLQASDRPTVMACLFGDTAAHSLGYRAHGLSTRAGFALALHDAQARARTASPAAW